MLLRALPSFASVVALASLVAFAGCGSGGSNVSGGNPDAATCASYSPPASFDPTAPVVSYVKDVAPVFSASCAFSDCHGSKTAPQGGMYLGDDADAAYVAIVNVASSALPSMPRVKPGTPADSFLLHKLDDDACTLAGCTSATCTALMPDGNTDPLPEATRLTIRAWIDQGAVSDVPHALDAGASDAQSGASLDAGASPADATAD